MAQSSRTPRALLSQQTQHRSSTGRPCGAPQVHSGVQKRMFQPRQLANLIWALATLGAREEVTLTLSPTLAKPHC